jgi:hypothetical protein
MKRLSLVGLPERGGLTFIGHELAGGADSLHGDGIVFGRVADDDTEFTALTAVDDDFGDHLFRIEVETVGFRAIHDAESASLFGHAFFIDDLRYVIHASSFLL